MEKIRTYEPCYIKQGKAWVDISKRPKQIEWVSNTNTLNK